ncbi:Beta-lactamase [Candidatus Sulfopaludibacter sp. SbA3]|nr:Beta-lactamase [Candidatus Sulfopaludibacter sp. SbA3]
MRITILLAAIALCAAAQPAVKRLDGSTISLQEIDASVSRLMNAAEVPGVAIAIVNGGKVALLKAYGFRDKEKKLPLTEDSVLAGASLSKAVFAYLVMQLVEDRTLDLDKPVQEYLPQPLPSYPAYRDLANDPRYRKITARMLLSHTSGFPNFRGLNEDLKLNINFEPGSRYAYSGEGIQLLQFVVEAITNRPLQSLMQERVFGPLGMSRTSMLSEARFENDYANGYDEWGRSLGHQQRSRADAAGSMQTTLRDFTGFLQAVIAGERLQKPAREQMLSPQIQILSKYQFPTLAAATSQANQAIRLSYGLGWGLYWSPYGKAFFKEGHDEGFRNYTVVFDRPKDGIVILTNSSNGEGIFQELLETLQRNTFTPIEWEGFTPYKELPPRKPLRQHTEIAIAPALLDRLTGRYALSAGLVLTVTRQDSHLAMQENDEAPEELFAEAELRFFSKTADDVVTFELDSQSQATRLTIHTGGRSIPVSRAR